MVGFELARKWPLWAAVRKRLSSSPQARQCIFFGQQRKRGGVEPPQNRFLDRLAARSVNSGALTFALWLHDHAIERCRGHVASMNDADAAQREARVRAPLPASTVIRAEENHARGIAGGEQSLVNTVVGDGRDVFRWKPRYGMFPGRAFVG